MELSSIAPTNSDPTLSATQIPAAAVSGSTETANANNDAAIVTAIEGAAANSDPLAMLDALKQIGGSGSANIAALVSVAKSATTENVDETLVNSIGKAGNANIYTAIRQNYANKESQALYIQQHAGSGNSTSNSVTA